MTHNPNTTNTLTTTPNTHVGVVTADERGRLTLKKWLGEPGARFFVNVTEAGDLVLYRVQS